MKKQEDSIPFEMGTGDMLTMLMLEGLSTGKWLRDKADVEARLAESYSLAELFAKQTKEMLLGFVEMFLEETEDCQYGMTIMSLALCKSRRAWPRCAL